MMKATMEQQLADIERIASQAFPTTGGRYVRNSDGTLKQVDAPPAASADRNAAPVKAPTKAARSEK